MIKAPCIFPKHLSNYFTDVVIDSDIAELKKLGGEISAEVSRLDSLTNAISDDRRGRPSEEMSDDDDSCVSYSSDSEWSDSDGLGEKLKSSGNINGCSFKIIYLHALSQNVIELWDVISEPSSEIRETSFMLICNRPTLPIPVDSIAQWVERPYGYPKMRVQISLEPTNFSLVY